MTVVVEYFPRLLGNTFLFDDHYLQTQLKEYETLKTFYDFGLENRVVRAITELGFEEPTPIQEKTIPIALEGRDLIGQAQTGTGKTAAFSIPLINRISTTEQKIVGLILTPTRELAIQVSEEIAKLSRYKGVRSLPIYGGQDIQRQIRLLRNKPHIIIGTPGRLLDHINRKTIKLDDVSTVVLDEADEMLDMGFMEDITSILSLVPEERHTMLFSATMPTNIQKLAQQFLREPEQVSVIPKQISAPLIQQNYIEVQEKQKFDALTRLLDMESPELAIIFGRTKRRVDELAGALQKCGYAADGLHGDLSQHQRDTVMRKFRDNSIEVLVATDVAARGLDVSGVSHVINFDLPQDPESYVHRIGRTGRAGREGTAWTFVTPREIDHLYFIEKITRHKLTRKPLPSVAEALEGKQKIAAEKLLEIVDSKDYGEYKGMAIQLLEQYDSVQLLSAAFKLLIGEKSDVEIELTPEEPVRVKKRFQDSRGGGGHRRFSGSGGNHSGHVQRGGRRDRDRDRDRGASYRDGARGNSKGDQKRKSYGDAPLKRERAFSKPANK